MPGMFRAAELQRIARRTDRAAAEKREDAAQPTPEERLTRLARQHRRLRRLLHRAR